MSITDIPSAGGVQEAVCLPLGLINGWLFGIDDSRIRDPRKREAVLRYKRECHAVLFEHFFGKATAALREDPEAHPAALQADPDAIAADRAEDRQWRLFKMAESFRQGFGNRSYQRFWIDQGLPTNPDMRDVYNHADLFSAAAQREAGHA